MLYSQTNICVYRLKIEQRTRYNRSDMLTWDDSFAIALALRDQHPLIDLENVSLEMIYHWTLEIPEFEDDPVLANDEILTAIVQEWLEEINPL